VLRKSAAAGMSFSEVSRLFPAVVLARMLRFSALNGGEL
jgi:hypothetical protein